MLKRPRDLINLPLSLIINNFSNTHTHTHTHREREREREANLPNKSFVTHLFFKVKFYVTG